MVSKSEGITYEELIKDIQARNFKPIYFLMGEEPFYIDRIADLITSSVLTAEEQEFDQIVVYGTETTVGAIINIARSFPMLGKYHVVIVREAQQLDKIEDLVMYVENPLFSTILVLCYKNKILDRRKKLASQLQKCGVLFESKPLYDSQLPSFINNYLASKSVSIETNATLLLAEHVGANLNKLVGELDKLIISLPQHEIRITTDVIERNIGISKEFNDFELVNALSNRDVFKANQIAKYFYNNQKANPIQRTLTIIFNYYCNLMLAYYAPQKTEQGIAEWLDSKPWLVRKNILPGMKNYSGTKVMQIIHQLRRTDAKTKGIDNSSLTTSDLLKELIFFILH